MSEEFKRKLRSLQFSEGHRGKSIKKPVQNEDTGRLAGYHTEYWDDRQDATVFAPQVSLRGEVHEGEVVDA